MTTKLIMLKDNILVEVDTKEGEVQQISSTSAEKVQNSLEGIRPILVDACKPVLAAWQDINQTMLIEKSELELGLSFEAEGNLYIAKAKTNATLTIKIVLKKPQEEAEKSVH